MAADEPARFLKCPACFKQFKHKEYLVSHMLQAGHSSHEPRCGHCLKHCKCLDALREHLLGPLAKKDCAQEFAKMGCPLCLCFFPDAAELTEHQASCELSALPENVPMVMPCSISTSSKRVQMTNASIQCGKLDKLDQRTAVALDCEMVGGGEGGSIDLCARVCLVDEQENVLLNIFVKPELPITDYRFEHTGLGPEYMDNAVPIQVARKAIEEVLCTGTKSWASRQNARLLVGHSLHHDLNCLGIDYPVNLRRDTAYYPPLLRTSNVCNKLQYLIHTYLGYRIQEDNKPHDPREDAVAAMRLYKRMRGMAHSHDNADRRKQSLLFRNRRELEAMSPEALLELSIPRFQCWCLDALRT